VTELRVDLELCERLVASASAGNRQASQELIQHLWPVWTALVRSSRSMGSLAHSDDHVRNVVTRLAGKVLDPDGRSLQSYGSWRQRHPDMNFDNWVRIVTANAIRDYLREQLGRRQSGSDEPSVKRLLNEFASSPVLEELGIRPPFTAAQTARELIEFGQRRLPPDQMRVLTLWLDGAGFEEIDDQLAVPAGQGRKLLRAALAVLRRHFGVESDAVDG
jgi:DNA-directed RNA polymerase specialized sigma24 family protein